MNISLRIPRSIVIAALLVALSAATGALVAFTWAATRFAAAKPEPSPSRRSRIEPLP